MWLSTISWIKSSMKVLQDSVCPLYEHFKNKTWLTFFSYQPDIFYKLNVPTTCIQRQNVNFFSFWRSFGNNRNTVLWKSLYESDTLEMFVNTSEYVEDYEF